MNTTRKKRRAAKIEAAYWGMVFALVVGLMLLCVLVFVVNSTLKQADLQNRGVVTQGSIDRFYETVGRGRNPSHNYYVVYTYWDSGEEYHSNTQFVPRKFYEQVERGEITSVAVRYDPQKPFRSEMEDGEENWRTSASMSCLLLLLAMAAFGQVIYSLFWVIPRIK